MLSVDPELLFAGLRGLSVALFVGGVVHVMERAPPFIGGIVLALPIVVGPSYFFLSFQQDAVFMQQAILVALGMIGAVLCFLTAYIRLIGRQAAPVALLGALLAWGCAALAVRSLPHGLAVMLGFTAAAGLLAWLVNRKVVVLGSKHAAAGDDPAAGGSSRPSPGYDVALRAACAGLLVALVTLLANRLGPLGSGLLATFPVALTVVCLFLLRRFTRAGARAALASSQIGLSSHAAFFLTLLALPGLATGWRFLAASLASAAWAAGLALARSRMTRSR